MSKFKVGDHVQILKHSPYRYTTEGSWGMVLSLHMDDLVVSFEYVTGGEVSLPFVTLVESKYVELSEIHKSPLYKALK